MLRHASPSRRHRPAHLAREECWRDCRRRRNRRQRSLHALKVGTHGGNPDGCVNWCGPLIAFGHAAQRYSRRCGLDLCKVCALSSSQATPAGKAGAKRGSKCENLGREFCERRSARAVLACPGVQGLRPLQSRVELVSRRCRSHEIIGVDRRGSRRTRAASGIHPGARFSETPAREAGSSQNICEVAW